MTSILSTKQKNRLFYWGFPCLVIAAFSLAILSVFPQSRDLIRNLVISNSRLVLAKADGDLTGEGQMVSVIKVQTADTLALEVFETGGEGQKLKFMRRIVLPEKKDAYFNFHQNTSNLVIADIDSDGTLEIIAPTFDDNLVPRLNVYKFNPLSRDFIRMGADSLNL